MNPFARSSTHVLVVEDEALIRWNAVEALEEDGFTVVEAADGREALALVEGGATVDVLFTDVNMPGAPNGVELADLLCDRLPNVRVIVASGRPVPTSILPCGGTFLPKPYRLSEVCATIHTLMDSNH